MPTIETVDGVKFNIYAGEHLPPHIHAIYNEHEVLLEIRTGKVYAGSFPIKQLAKADKWLLENRDEALEIFNTLNPQLNESNKRSSQNSKN